MATKGKTAGLEKRRLVEVKERQRSREANLAATSAKADADRARDQLIEALAAGADAKAVRAAEKARTVARDHVEDATIKSEAAQLRAQRAGHARQAYEVEHALALLEELSPAAGEVAARLERSARELIGADAEWSTISQRVSELVVAVPNASPIADSPGSHVLADIARDLRRVLAESEVESPAPHFRELSRRDAA